MRLEITFSDSPTLDEYSRLLLAVTEVWPDATVTETNLLRQGDRGDYHVIIDCRE